MRGELGRHQCDSGTSDAGSDASADADADLVGVMPDAAYGVPSTCPADVPQNGSACTAAGAYCGYSNQPNPCGADNCYCQGGAWSCGPTCVFDAGTSDAPAGG